MEPPQGGDTWLSPLQVARLRLTLAIMFLHTRLGAAAATHTRDADVLLLIALRIRARPALTFTRAHRDLDIRRSDYVAMNTQASGACCRTAVCGRYVMDVQPARSAACNQHYAEFSMRGLLQNKGRLSDIKVGVCRPSFDPTCERAADCDNDESWRYFLFRGYRQVENGDAWSSSEKRYFRETRRGATVSKWLAKLPHSQLREGDRLGLLLDGGAISMCSPAGITYSAPSITIFLNGTRLGQISDHALRGELCWAVELDLPRHESDTKHGWVRRGGSFDRGRSNSGGAPAAAYTSHRHEHDDDEAHQQQPSWPQHQGVHVRELPPSIISDRHTLLRERTAMSAPEFTRRLWREAHCSAVAASGACLSIALSVASLLHSHCYIHAACRQQWPLATRSSQPMKIW